MARINAWRSSRPEYRRKNIQYVSRTRLSRPPSLVVRENRNAGTSAIRSMHSRNTIRFSGSRLSFSAFACISWSPVLCRSPLLCPLRFLWRRHRGRPAAQLLQQAVKPALPRAKREAWISRVLLFVPAGHAVAYVLKGPPHRRLDFLGSDPLRPQQGRERPRVSPRVTRCVPRARFGKYFVADFTKQAH